MPRIDDYRFVNETVKGLDVADGIMMWSDTPPGQRKWVIFKCPCGCGHVSSLPVTENLPGGTGAPWVTWGLELNGDKPTLSPSIQSTDNTPDSHLGAGSVHYHIRNGRVEWC